MKYYIRPGKMTEPPETGGKAMVMIDFTYQKLNDEYVSDAFVNFTLHQEEISFIKEASFLFLENKNEVELLDIKTLDRNAAKDFIRVATILKKGDVKSVLEALNSSSCVLKIKQSDGSQKIFIPSEDIIYKINQAFSR